MSYKRLPIIVYYDIDGKQRKIILTKHHAVARYRIDMDTEFLGEVFQINFQWRVVPYEGSWLQGKDTEPILQAVIEAEKDNPILGT